MTKIMLIMSALKGARREIVSRGTCVTWGPLVRTAEVSLRARDTIEASMIELASMAWRGEKAVVRKLRRIEGHALAEQTRKSSSQLHV